MKGSQGHVIMSARINIRKRVLSHFGSLDNLKDSTLSSSIEKD
jgi:hypothetical protein